ncbi:MAG: hypothetical protein Q9191_005459 [Dirinaria sp. TL-2023a]
MTDSERTFYLLEPFKTIPVGEDLQEWLGRIVPDYRHPSANFRPAKSNTAMRKKDILDDPGWKDVEEVISRAKTSTLKLAMASMLRASHENEQSHAPTFSAPRVHRIQLMQEDDYLQRVLGLDEVGSKLRDWHHRDRPVYMIVTLLIADAVRYAEEDRDKRTTELEVKAPAELAPLAAASGLPIPGPDSVNAAASLSTERRVEAKLTGVGKRIFAIEYRPLTKRFFSFSGKVDLRPGGVRGDRMFGHVEASMTTPEPEEQQSDIIADYDPLPDVVDEAEADEYCFTFDD